VRDQRGELDLAASGETDGARVGVVHPPDHRDREAAPPGGRGRERDLVVIGDARQHYPAARSRRGDRQPDGRTGSGDLERDVDPAWRHVASGCGRIGGRIGGRVGAQPVRGLPAVRQRIERHDLAGTGDAQQLDQEQPDRPAADHSRPAAQRQVAQVERVRRDPERLEQGALAVGHRVGQWVQQRVRPG
jgi:hypothetical protein